jgi:hypothetical protein
MSSDPVDQVPEAEKPFDWMRAFQSGPANFPERKYVPPRDTQLRQAEELELLNLEILKLAEPAEGGHRR